MSRDPIVLVVSDATGETGEQAAKSALAQFGPVDDSTVRVLPKILSSQALEHAVLEAKDHGALLVYTLVGPDLRAHVKDLAQVHRVKTVDLLGRLISGLARHLGRDPFSVPGLGYELTEEYYERMAAIEWTVQNDDGRNPQNLPDADIVLVGISRTSKTPLSNHIAQRGYRASNVPIVLDVPPPKELSDVDPRRVFGLTIDPVVLMKIRQARMETLRMNPDSDYGDLRQIRREITYAKRLFARHPEWTVIDMSRKAVEEAASVVLEAYRARFVSGAGPDEEDES